MLSGRSGWLRLRSAGQLRENKPSSSTSIGFYPIFAVKQVRFLNLYLSDRPPTLTFQPLISTLRPFYLKLRSLSLELRPQNSSFRPLTSELLACYSKNKAQNPERRAIYSNIQALSFNGQPQRANSQDKVELSPIT